MAEEYTEYEQMRKNSHPVLKTVLKVIVIALILFVYGAVMIRSCARNPEKHILYSPELKAALDAGDVEIYYQNPYDKINRNDAGTFQFSVSDIYYIPKTKQLQVTVRYNLAVLRDAAEKYELSDVPEDDVFAYSLLFDSGARITTSRYSSYTKSGYRFIYLLFDNVDLDAYTLVKYTADDAAITNSEGEIIAHETDDYGKTILYETNEDGFAKVYLNRYVSLETYYKDDINYNKTPLSSLMVFNRMYNFELVKDKEKYIDYKGDFPIYNSIQY